MAQLWTPVMSATMFAMAVPITFLFFWRFFAKKPHSGTSFQLPVPEQADPHWKGKRGPTMDLRDSNPRLIRCLCPATGQFLGTVEADDFGAIDGAVEAARGAQGRWSRTTFADRKRVLQTILRYVLDNQAAVARVACRDTGKTMVDAALGEIMVTLEKLKWIMRHGEEALATSRRPGSSSRLMFYKGAEVRYQPLGVVMAMVSWNYPLHNMMGPIAAGLFAGNAVVVKCSEQVAWSSRFFVQIAKRALEAEGFDPDLVQLLCCWPEDADYLTAHRGINHITFIGSRPVAHRVCAAAARSLTPVVAELGGKDPLIVLDDLSASKVAEVASIILRGTFQSAGQNCIGVERVIALPRAHQQLEDILARRVKAIRVGAALDELGDIDMGALINGAAIDRIEALVASAVASGAKLLAGGHRFSHPKYPLGFYFEPTLLADVTPDMDIAQHEVFGPVLVLMKAQSVDDAIAIANSTEFGLGASVFGSSRAALEKITDELRTGNVAINDFATYHLCQLPFGGVDGSGYGKFSGAEGLRGLCIEKSVCYDRFPFISTFIPKVLDYPLPSMAKAWSTIEAMQEIGYGSSIWTMIKGIRKITGI